MDITPIKKDGLFREYSASVSSTTLQEKVDASIAKEAETFKMAGFREGKVPISLVKRQIGAEILKRELRKAVDDSVKAILQNSGERPAMPPEVEVSPLEEGQDIKITVTFDALPAIPEINLSNISLESAEIKVSPEDVTKAKDEILRRFAEFKDADDGYKAQNGDSLVVDFVGTIDGEEFKGGKATDIKIDLGVKQFLPGFEEQLINSAVGDQKEVNITFPDDFPNYGGRQALFKVNVKKVLINTSKLEWNDELAKKMGFENIEKLEQLVNSRMATDFAVMARFQTKKQLFDILDTEYNFDVPNKMLNADIKQLMDDMRAKNKELSNRSDEDLMNDCKPIAIRRVKLGLLLAEIARNHKIVISENDLREAIAAQVMQMPDKQKEIIDHYSKHENLKMLEGPILEEKTVDFILTQINLNKIPVTADEFAKKFSMNG